MSSNRDTQFAGFAEALFYALDWNDINIDMENDGWEDRWKLIIARRAYDLVASSFVNVKEFEPLETIATDEQERQYIREEVMPQISDLPELPEVAQ